MTHVDWRRPWAEEHTRTEMVDVPAHKTPRLIVDGDAGLSMGIYGGADWVFTFARTGCLRIQRGDFCAYVPLESLDTLAEFIKTNSR